MTKAQERARARRRYEQQQRAAAARQAESTRTRRAAVIAVTVIVILAGFVALSAQLGKKPAPAVARTPALTAAGCPAPPASLGTGAQLTLPDKKLVEGKQYTAEIETNCGTITVSLDGAKAPQAVASFKQLADKNYWLNSPCHRLTTAGIFVLQCGDPTGTGQGTPGYGFGVENEPTDNAYPRGTLAMARTQDKAKGNGGQFFIVYKDTTLPGGYSIFGTVTAGMDIVDKIAAAGVAGGSTDGSPEAPISILRVVVTEKKA